MGFFAVAVENVSPCIENRPRDVAARADGRRLLLLVGSSGCIEGVHTHQAQALIEASEQRDGGEALQSKLEVRAHENTQPSNLAFVTKRVPFDFLDVLEFEGEQARELNAESGGARDTDGRVRIGKEQFHHVVLDDPVAGARTSISGECDGLPTRMADGNDRRRLGNSHMSVAYA